MYVCDIDRDCKSAKLPAWSRHVMVTCMVLRNKKMSSNIQLTTGRDREIAGLILLFR